MTGIRPHEVLDLMYGDTPICRSERYNLAIFPCPSTQALASATTTSPPSSARAGWARCIALTIRSSGGMGEVFCPTRRVEGETWGSAGEAYQERQSALLFSTSSLIAIPIRSSRISFAA